MYKCELKRLYEQGFTIVEVAEKAGISRSKCYRNLLNSKTRFRSVGRRNKVNKDHIYSLRQQGKSYRDIADTIGVSHVTIYNILKKHLTSQVQ